MLIFQYKTGNLPQQQVTPPGIDNNYFSVATDGTNWVISGRDSLGGGTWHSTDRVNWARSTTVIPAARLGLRHVATDGAGTWLALPVSGSQIYKSTDNGDTWIEKTPPPGFGTSQKRVGYLSWANRWVIVGVDQAQSDDGGETWQDMTLANLGWQVLLISSTRALIHGDTFYPRQTISPFAWQQINAAGNVSNVKGGWYEPSLDKYFFTTNIGKIGVSPGLSYEPEDPTPWALYDIDTSSTTRIDFVFQSPTENHLFVCDNNGKWYKPEGGSIDPYDAWVEITSGDFFGASAGRYAASDGNHYVVVCANAEVYTK